VSPYTWQVTTGSLPAGLTLSGNTISGSPTGVGRVYGDGDGCGDADAQTATKQLTITVNPALSITDRDVGGGHGRHQLQPDAGGSGRITPYAWAVTSGSLPAGLTLNASTGAITGKPTGPQVGQINFTVTVTDSEESGQDRERQPQHHISAHH